MAAEHRRDDEGTPSLPETERRARAKEAEDDSGHSGAPSLPEAERREREAEAEKD